MGTTAYKITTGSAPFDDCFYVLDLATMTRVSGYYVDRSAADRHLARLVADQS